MKLITSFLFAAICMVAADATGTWTGTITRDDQNEPKPAHMVLKQTGEKVTGTAGPNESEQFDIEEGKVVEGRLTFKLTEHGMSFNLKQEGDRITGAVVRERDGETRHATLDLKRKP